MRVRLTDGAREVGIRTDGTGDDPAVLRQIERTARRLIDAMPTPPRITTPAPFGFARQHDLGGVALDSSHELSDQDEIDLDCDQDEGDAP